MRVLIVGQGSAGRRHLVNTQHLFPDFETRLLSQRVGETAGGWDEIKAFHPDAAIIAGPASHRMQTALPLAEQGCHLLLEKPIADRLDGVDDLIDLCARHRRVLMVVYPLRFRPALRVMRDRLRSGDVGRVLWLRAEVGQYLPDWRPDADYRETVTAQRHLGGGVLLELSHEIDAVRWLLGDPDRITALTARVGDLDIDVDDVADMQWIYDGADGATRLAASLHLDCLRRDPVRTCVAIGTEGTLACDLITGSLSRFDGNARSWNAIVHPGDRATDDIHQAQIAHFFDCVRSGATPAVDGKDGRRTLEIALLATQSAALGRTLSLPALPGGPVQ